MDMGNYRDMLRLQTDRNHMMRFGMINLVVANTVGEEGGVDVDGPDGDAGVDADHHREGR